MDRIKSTKNQKTKINRNENTIKQIDSNNKPHWYTQYPWSPVPDNVKNFFGREIEFVDFWTNMAKLVHSGSGKKANYAFVGQRKLGKTAYLKRCYNIAFWEQDEVVPFYYSFAQNDEHSYNILLLSYLQKTIPIEFLQQFFSFCTKDDVFIKLQTVSSILDHAKKIKFPKLERLLRCVNDALDRINNSEDVAILQNIWQLTQDVTIFMRKKCLLIIDEAQEMDISISDIIQKDHSVVFVSGTNMVNNFLDYSTANCFEKQPFRPLELEDAKKLIHKICPNGYKELANDLLKLVGGNPHYIACILTFNMRYMKEHKKEKDFSSKKGLDKAYNFEVLNPKGRIYDFWNVHIRQNKDDLNQDPKGKKGLALQLLYKISSNQEKEFTYSELMEEFGVNEDILVKKIEQLEHANLIEPMGISRLALGFPDLVLPAFINKFYHQLIIEGPSKNVSEMAKEDYEKMIQTFTTSVFLC